ncbi:transcriptional regulator [Paenibacillus sp. CAA11]|uniref:helix-turn-helix transcriptional regulator n=1 Tax=Paenibacillus sp. CAA11 TaxID=1532905 RepID=UPI000D3436DF|nr:YafY family protein [Paenibacillus sp. CAA11]AWB44207.1 transcriptional regulator [Paenibacillus sp. CAA11]
MKADRLITILLLLQNHGKMSVRDLAERLEVSSRTVVRDLEALASSGIPVYALRGSNGGWTLAEGYRTRLTGMKSAELTTLLLSLSGAAHLLEDLGSRSDSQAAAEKLLAASPVEIRKDAEILHERIHIDGISWFPKNESAPLLTALYEAVWDQRPLKIRYPKGDYTEERTICPLGLVAKGTIWYVVALVQDAELRTFRVSRMLSAEPLSEHFERPADFHLASYWEASTAQFKAALPRYQARLQIREEHWDRFTREKFVQLVPPIPLDNGWLETEAEFHTLESAGELLLRYTDNIKVLCPEELRQHVVDQALSIIRLYSNGEA